VISLGAWLIAFGLGTVGLMLYLLALEPIDFKSSIIAAGFAVCGLYFGAATTISLASALLLRSTISV